MKYVWSFIRATLAAWLAMVGCWLLMAFGPPTPWKELMCGVWVIILMGVWYWAAILAFDREIRKSGVQL